ncbi:MAG TPA: hypothetical protein IAA75_00575 [Candidatus Pullichristensenella avicola]|nr:hypothetical protein [Candidatus Pullichristensenella avicola]
MARGTLDNALNAGRGILQLMPNWIPRTFNRPGKRLRLHPDDYLGFGIQRGFIEERWLSSTTCTQLDSCDAEEGLSRIRFADNTSTLREAVETFGAELIGDFLWKTYGRFPVFSKFFDYYYPSFHHVHHKKEEAERVGAQPKPEAYFFPPQMNATTLGTRPIAYFGFDPATTREQVLACLQMYTGRDNHITELSRAYPLTLGTGWYTPAGVLHSTGSLCTYEPQWCSDVSSIWQNVDEGLQRYDREYLFSYVPDDKKADLDYVLNIMDWEINTDPDYRKKYYRPPILALEDETYVEKWIAYGTDNQFAAKELTVMPGKEAMVRDSAAYGCIIIQGHGRFGVYKAEAAQMLRFGQPSADEYFVGERAARDGVRICNESDVEPMVILKHFAMNCGMPW